MVFLYIIQIFNLNNMNNTIHFFDLDRTLWSVDTRPWLINKNNPSKPLIRLSKEETLYILSGIYKNDELMINYNGKSFWISNEILDKITKKYKSLNINDLGISFTEKTNPEYFNHVKYFIENIRHLSQNTKVDIGIISDRYSVDNDNELLKVLKEKLSEIGLSISKFFYTNDYYNNSNNNNNKTNNDKMNILLEHMVGYHIEGNHFKPIKQDFYKTVHFYDDESQNINVANTVQHYLELYLSNTDDDVFNRIISRINKATPTLYTHLITNNQLNRFKSTKITLVEPIKYSIKIDESKIVKNFKNFKK